MEERTSRLHGLFFIHTVFPILSIHPNLRANVGYMMPTSFEATVCSTKHRQNYQNCPVFERGELFTKQCIYVKSQPQESHWKVGIYTDEN